jgi:hypothetical protein
MGQWLGQVMPPLDSLFGGQNSFYHRAMWRYSFAWLPHRCIRSNQLIWLKYGYMGMAMYTGPGTPVYEYNWHTTEEHLIWCLKNG